MKKNWLPEELVECWTLLEDELALLTQTSDENRLGFALLFKFFQIYARFPENQKEISSTVVNYVAKLLTGVWTKSSDRSKARIEEQIKNRH